jgi:hypothetical protein
MGIQKKEFYVVKCDFCKISLENGEGGELCLQSKESALEHMKLAMWTRKNNKTACCDCWEKLT